MKKEILIVEDQLINRKILKKMLSDQYEVYEAADGKEALSLLSLHGSTISAVLSDIVMPVMDGYELIRQMKADEILKQIPIIVLSGSEEVNDNKEVLALSVGANDYITKPYKMEIIKHRLNNVINTRETADFINTVQHDALTGVFSKEYFYANVDNTLRNSGNNKYDIIVVNINSFKVINDLFGKKIGDDVLKYLAGMITKHVESIGIVGRIGSDKFATLIPHMNEYKPEFFETGLKEINQFNVALSITLRYGIYQINDLLLPVDAMCDRASLACDSVKKQYDSNFVVYDESIRQNLLKDQFILNEAKNAIQNKEFEVYYQPKYEINHEKIVGAEALVRWNSPKKGFVSPGDFIPLFEKNGFITRLDMYIWETVCDDLHKWREKGNDFVPVSVNVSRVDLYNPHLIETFLYLTKKYELSPKDLHLEITESAYTENSVQLIKITKKLRELGFVIEMDDFGSGYSSLNMLSTLPLDVLKLDMKFVQNETAKKESKNILGFVISLAKWMNLSVIAEGVENKKQIEILKNMDCNYVQGYYFSKPLPKTLFESHLLEHGILKESDISQAKNINNEIQSVPKNTEKRVMMIVDDVRLNRVILAKLFSQNYTIVEADNGLSALEYIEKNKDRIDVILLDLVMPVMDGFKMLTKLKANEDLKNIPVIITSQAGEDNESRSLAMGAADFIAKPYNPNIALRRVANVIATSKISQLETEKELFKKMKEMEQLAKQDTLTGLCNRNELEMQVNSFFANSENKEAVFIILDIDNFKLVNDRFGHVTGDNLLKDVAEKLNSCFRNVDVVSRMGGDEFAVFLRSNISNKELKAIMKRIFSKMRFMIEDMNISCSIGVSSSPLFGNDYQTLYENADIALMTAKRLGKNQYQVYDGTSELPSHVLFRNMDWLLDAASDAILVSDAENFELLYVNDAAAKLSGKTKKACIGKRCYETLWKRNSQCENCPSVNRLNDGYIEQEVYLKDVDKTYIIRTRIVDWGGRPARIQFVQDNTFKAKTEKQLVELSNDRKRLLDMMPCGIFRYYVKSDQFDFVSEHMLEMLGYTSEEFTNKFHNKFEEMVYKDDRKRVIKEINDQIKNSDTDECEYRIEKKDGSLCWYHDVGHLVKGENGEDMFYVTIMDVSYRHQVFEELMDEKMKQQIALNQCDMQYWEIDLLTDTCINKIKDARHGFKVGEVTQNSSKFFKEKGIIPKEYFKIYEDNQKALKDGVPIVSYEIPLNDLEGKQHWWLFRATSLLDEQKKPVKAIYTAENIEKLREYQKRDETLLRECKVQTFVLDIENRRIRDYSNGVTKYINKATVLNIPDSLIEAGNVFEEDIENFKEMHQQVYNGAKNASCVVRLRKTPNDSWYKVKVSLTTVFDNFNQPVKAFGISKVLDGSLEDDIELRDKYE